MSLARASYKRKYKEVCATMQRQSVKRVGVSCTNMAERNWNGKMFSSRTVSKKCLYYIILRTSSSTASSSTGAGRQNVGRLTHCIYHGIYTVARYVLPVLYATCILTPQRPKGRWRVVHCFVMCARRLDVCVCLCSCVGWLGFWRGWQRLQSFPFISSHVPYAG